MASQIRIASLIFGMLLLLTQFQNCAESLPDTAQAQGTTASSAPSGDAATNLNSSSVSPASGSGACRTAFGQDVPNGGQIRVYAAATVSCPGSCVGELQTCVNGQLSGSFTGQSGSCSVNACVYKLTNSYCVNASGSVMDPLLPNPATCAAVDFNKTICGYDPNWVHGEYRCSSP